MQKTAKNIADYMSTMTRFLYGHPLSPEEYASKALHGFRKLMPGAYSGAQADRTAELLGRAYDFIRPGTGSWTERAIRRRNREAAAFSDRVARTLQNPNASAEDNAWLMHRMQRNIDARRNVNRASWLDHWGVKPRRNWFSLL